MNKIEFLSALRAGLKTLSENEINQHTQYYSEMICDMVEDGLTEEEAIASIGTIDEITAQILGETTLQKSDKKEKRKLKTWEIVLLAAGSPIWFSLLVAAFAVVLSLVASAFSAIISFYAATFALGAVAAASIPYSIFMIASGNTAGGIFILGAGLICAGLTVFAVIGTTQLTKLIVKLIKKLFVTIKKCFKRKENA